MNRVVVDASAIVAIAFNEPSADAVARRLEGAAVCAPTLLKFELANAAWKKIRRQPDRARPILQALAALATGLTAYDASYLWLAGSLGADLVTLDTRLADATA